MGGGRSTNGYASVCIKNKPKVYTRASLLDLLSKVAVCNVHMLEVYIWHSNNRSTTNSWHYFCVRDWGFLDTFVMCSLVSEWFHSDKS